MKATYLRRISQGLFLLLFLWLLIRTESKGADELGYPVKIFLDADPLIFITTFLSSRAIDNIPYLALALVIAAALLGRFFCGWLCPLGTLHDLAGSAFTKKPSAASPRSLRRLKYYLLLFLLISSLFSLHLTGLFDPLSFLIRSFSLSVYPLFSYATQSVFDAFYNLNTPLLVNISETLYGLLKKALLPFRQPFYLQSLFIGLLFFLVLGLNMLEKRFWCKNLCPLGALLGLPARYAPFKRIVSDKCIACVACQKTCSGGAVSSDNETWQKSDCILCLNCKDRCPGKAVRFHFKGTFSPAPLDLGRRRIVAVLLAGATAVPLMSISPLGKKTYREAKLIRPPGALAEGDFLNRCVKCGECMKVCITNGLQPTFLEAGVEGIWTPMLIPRIGHCERLCTLCGQVCPTGAIRKLALEEKLKTKIGLAMIDKSRCLPHAHGVPCIVCEEVCPVPGKAVRFEKVAVTDRSGKKTVLQQPCIDLTLCVGCGICEAKCPVQGQPAVYVTNLGESRSKDNQLLLP